MSETDIGKVADFLKERMEYDETPSKECGCCGTAKRVGFGVGVVDGDALNCELNPSITLKVSRKGTCKHHTERQPDAATLEPSFDDGHHG